MKKFRGTIIICLITISMINVIGCAGNSDKDKEQIVDTEMTNLTETEEEVKVENTQIVEEIVAPSKEEVLTMRAIVLEGMSEEEIDRLTENIKIANLKMEEAYLYDDLFGKLEDENHLYWNYFDEKGDIQIGWAYDGDLNMKDVCEQEDLTKEAFYEKYGTPVMDYNRFDADNFIDLMNEMKNSVHNETLQNDIQYIIDETKLAAQTHEMEHANNIYKTLHDMDYFLLRYGIEDVGKYIQDDAIVSKYYGMLTVYSKSE